MTLVVWTADVMAQGPSPEANQTTYTPMRRPGSAVPPQAAPVSAPPPVLPYAPLPVQTYAPSSPSPGQVEARSAFARQGAPPTVAAATTTSTKLGRRTLGLALDLGAPDGINLGLVISPADWLRLGGSFGTNTASLAYRGGLSFVPVGWGPSFSFEAGHCNLAPTNSVIRTFFSVPAWVAPYVQELGYTYFNAHLGFDLVLGNVTLFLHGGYTFLIGTVRAPKSVVVDTSTGTTVTVAEDGKVYAQTLSAKLGLVFLFGGS